MEYLNDFLIAFSATLLVLSYFFLAGSLGSFLARVLPRKDVEVFKDMEKRHREEE
jgi:hypothetical protein